MFVLASFGGLFWPIHDLPRQIQAIANTLVTTWSMSAIQDVMFRGRSLAGVSTDCSVLAVYGVVSFLIASRLFRYGEEV